MSNQYHTPEGVRDITPSEYTRKTGVEHRILKLMEQEGFLLMQTPSFEFFDVFASDIGTVPSTQLYKFYDKEGNTLVLRPDFTPAMARAYSRLYYNEPSPVRLCYCGNTFINGDDLDGRLKESTQIGAELYNDDSCEADAAMISLVVNCMKTAGFSDFAVSVGNANYFKGLCDELGISESGEVALLRLISAKNHYKAKDLLADLNIDSEHTDLIVNLSDEYTSKDSLYALMERTRSEVCREALMRLVKICDILEERGIDRYIRIDLGLLNKYNYYTGVLFRAYTYGSGDAVMKGGRYDNLVGKFGRDVPAIGFGISVDEVVGALDCQEASLPRAGEYLTFALTKGRLADKTMEILGHAGITCEEITEKGTRKLIFVNDELKLRFFLAKGPDVPTYVEHGAADIGVVGADTIAEENRKVYEVLDLKTGNCRMCVCGPENAKALLDKRDIITVATKYPRTAKSYFNDVRHRSVDIIKLNGSIELAPIIGLSDCIVDIVETGSTLRENGLTVLDKISDISARMIVNPVSMRLQTARINDIIDRIREVL